MSCFPGLGADLTAWIGIKFQQYLGKCLKTQISRSRFTLCEDKSSGSPVSFAFWSGNLLSRWGKARGLLRFLPSAARSCVGSDFNTKNTPKARAPAQLPWDVLLREPVSTRVFGTLRVFAVCPSNHQVSLVLHPPAQCCRFLCRAQQELLLLRCVLVCRGW